MDKRHGRNGIGDTSATKGKPCRMPDSAEHATGLVTLADCTFSNLNSRPRRAHLTPAAPVAWIPSGRLAQRIPRTQRGWKKRAAKSRMQLNYRSAERAGQTARACGVGRGMPPFVQRHDQKHLPKNGDALRTTLQNLERRLRNPANLADCGQFPFGPGIAFLLSV